MTESIEKWKKAIVNIELGNKHMISKDRPKGTAIFAKFNEKYFLITAAHLLMNKSASFNESKFYEYIIRIPSYNEITDETKRNQMKKRIAFNGDDITIYVGDPGDKAPGDYFSVPIFFKTSDFPESDYCAYSIDQERDLAVISLRPRFPKLIITGYHFAQELESLGYEPMCLSDIKCDESNEGSDIYTLGYPSDICLIKESFENFEGFDKWNSVDITLPIVAFGKIALFQENLDYFWGDLRVYPGNSGGPVIENGKLIGIIIRQGIITGNQEIEYLAVPFAKAIKAKFIEKLINEQILKDNSLVQAIRNGSLFGRTLDI